jgi:hypothetical protein
MRKKKKSLGGGGVELKGNRPLGRLRHRWEDDIKIDLKK